MPIGSEKVILIPETEFSVERMEGVLIMAANIKALPRMDMSISGALRTQFMMIIVSGVELSSLSE